MESGLITPPALIRTGAAKGVTSTPSSEVNEGDRPEKPNHVTLLNEPDWVPMGSSGVKN
jgi:hypothetical protein